jgi:hypothetical protein
MGLVERARHLLDLSAEQLDREGPRRLVELVALGRELETLERSVRTRVEYTGQLAARAAAELGLWERRAAEAVLAGREDAARAALRRKQEAEARRENVRAEAERRELELVEIQSLRDEVSEAVMKIRPSLGSWPASAEGKSPDPPRSAEIEAELRRLRERALGGRRLSERSEA